MELLIVTLLALVAGETTYLTYKSRPRNKVDKTSLLIDTSVLIDGRILPIARSGLITAPMIIPRSVIRELQYMADKADHEKRERAREGLDMIEQLKHIEAITIDVIDDVSQETGVDERLVELARKYGARLCTVDYNLNKSARAQGAIVVNINELAHALRIVHLPGETITLELMQPGQGQGQAVGYLDDGTMVVVDDARKSIGLALQVEVTRVIQTAAGKMLFAKKHSTHVATPAVSSTAVSDALNPRHRRAQKPTQAQQNEPKDDASTGQRRRRHPRSNQPRQTAEDTLVDLANE